VCLLWGQRGDRTIRYAVFIADASGLRDEIELRSGVKMKSNSQSKLD
jgi:hypothetical protein